MQNEKKESTIKYSKNDLHSLNRKLDEYGILENEKQNFLAAKESELQRKKDALASAQTELRRIEVDLA